MIEEHEGLLVQRDDLRPGGSKTRFLPAIIPAGTKEVVFGGPFCGGAPVALATVAAERGFRCTLFYAERAELHVRQKQARALGARLRGVRPGYMTVVQKRARDYCARSGALFFPLGFDLPEAREAYLLSMREERFPSVPEVWCAMGSGMLAQTLARRFPRATIHAVAVGLRSRWSRQSFPGNVRIHEQPLRFEQPFRAFAPFPSCPNYCRKAWHLARREAKPGSLFWNVLGD